MDKKIVAIFVGGPSSEREVSLASAQPAYDALLTSQYFVPELVEVTAQKKYIINGEEVESPQADDCARWSVVLNLIYGTFGEDGDLQKLLEKWNLVHTSSSSEVSALTFDKEKTAQKVALLEGLVSLPRTEVLRESDNVEELNLAFPVFVKPNASGSSCGVSKVSDRRDLEKAMQLAFSESKSILVQEAIEGQEFSCAVLGNHNGDMIVLPVAEIIAPQDKSFFDYEAKYHSQETQEVVPAHIPEALAEKIKEISVRIHAHLKCDVLTRIDYMYDGERLYFLEINSMPGLAPASITPKEALAEGITFPELLETMCRTALEKSS